MTTQLKPFEWFWGNPKYGWDGGAVTAYVLWLHDWRIDNEPWVEICEN